MGRALRARTYALLSKRLLFLNIFIGFSAEIVIRQIWGALDSGGLNSNYRMSEDQKKKNTFEFRERIKAVKSTFARNVAIYFF